MFEFTGDKTISFCDCRRLGLMKPKKRAVRKDSRRKPARISSFHGRIEGKICGTINVYVQIKTKFL